jgi:predicted nucleic acid-binding protein
MRNVLALYIRKNLLSLVDAQQIMAGATDLMQGQEYEVTSNQVLDLVNVSSCSAYDCEFVSLAQDLKVSLVTVDRQILMDFPNTALSLEAFIGAS